MIGDKQVANFLKVSEEQDGFQVTPNPNTSNMKKHKSSSFNTEVRNSQASD